MSNFLCAASGGASFGEEGMLVPDRMRTLFCAPPLAVHRLEGVCGLLVAGEQPADTLQSVVRTRSGEDSEKVAHRVNYSGEVRKQMHEI